MLTFAYCRSWLLETGRRLSFHCRSCLCIATSITGLALALNVEAANLSATTNDVSSSMPTPLAQWFFAQADGDFVPDATGHGYDAKIHGKPEVVARWAGQKALEFDGSGDNAFWRGGEQNCGLSIRKRLNRGFKEMSIEAWVRKSPAWWMAVLFRDKWDDPSGFGLYTEWQSGKVVFGHYDASNTGSTVQSETTIQDEEWHHVVGTLQSNCEEKYLYRIYVDGKLDAEQVGTWAVEEAPAEGGILKIAYPNRTGADQPYKGALDGITLFDVALTPAQVSSRFEAGRKH